MDAFGDISGIVFNRRSGNVIGGTQRSRNLDENSKVTVTKRFATPTKRGTVATGYVLHKGERFSYREVDWSEETETAAMLAANENAGEWDNAKLKDAFKRLGADFDKELTMFDEGRLKKFSKSLDAWDTGDDQEDDDEAKSEDERSPSKLVHECPRCGFEFR